MVRRAAALTCAALLLGAAAADTAVPAWALRTPEAAALEFHGVVSFDQAGAGTYGMLYPAPTVGFGIAAVFAHGAIASGARKEQKLKLQQKADEVLAPHRTVIDGLSAPDLMRDGFARTTIGGGTLLAPAEKPPATGLVIESLPVFAMTQDRRTLILDNAFIVRRAETPKAKVPAYQNVVRIVTSPRDGQDLAEAWNADGGRALREEMARMYAESLELALRDVGADPAVDAAVPFKTVRYREGGEERIERARPIGGGCGRMVLRNLRGWLMSVPVNPDSIGAAITGPCAAAPEAVPAAPTAAELVTEG